MRPLPCFASRSTCGRCLHRPNAGAVCPFFTRSDPRPTSPDESGRPRPVLPRQLSVSCVRKLAPAAAGVAFALTLGTPGVGVGRAASSQDRDAAPGNEVRAQAAVYSIDVILD